MVRSPGSQTFVDRVFADHVKGQWVPEGQGSTPKKAKHYLKVLLLHLYVTWRREPVAVGLSVNASGKLQAGPIQRSAYFTAYPQSDPPFERQRCDRLPARLQGSKDRKWVPVDYMAGGAADTSLREILPAHRSGSGPSGASNWFASEKGPSENGKRKADLLSIIWTMTSR